MQILMMTNTFTPHVGGVARSVQSFVDEFRLGGHRVIVAAPMFKGTPDDEQDVVRFPAMQEVNGSDFSVPVPEPRRLTKLLREFKPDIIHAHHPFLLGGAALRLAATHRLPLVFTHHTMYERYTHYMANNSNKLKRFVVDLVTGYCNLCDAVIAPSETIAQILRERGVDTPIEVIPTGINTNLFYPNDNQAAVRRQYGIPENAFLVGHVGRFAKEKNMEFLIDAIAHFLSKFDNAHLLLIGAGPLRKQIESMINSYAIASRCTIVGFLKPTELAEAYRTMDVFAFASHSETQGIVLAEAMASGVPVVAVDAPGVREIVKDGTNGRLIRRDDKERFVWALKWIAQLDTEQKNQLKAAALAYIVNYDMKRTADKTLQLYQSLLNQTPRDKVAGESAWDNAFRRLRGEWQIVRNVIQAAGDSIRPRLVWEVGPHQEFGESSSLTEQKIEEANEDNELEPEMTPNDSPSLKGRALGWLWSTLLKAQCATWKKNYEGLDRLDEVLSQGHKVLFSFWHGKYVPLFALLRGRPCCVFTSKSPRGEVIVDICRRFGYYCEQIPIRKRGGLALEVMKRALARNPNGGIAVDGPLGPYHKVKRGPIKLASELGFVIVPASVCALRKRVIKHRWDKLELPGLFTTIGFAIGEPMFIPPNLSVDQVVVWTEQLRLALEALDKRAEELANT